MYHSRTASSWKSAIILLIILVFMCIGVVLWWFPMAEQFYHDVIIATMAEHSFASLPTNLESSQTTQMQRSEELVPDVGTPLLFLSGVCFIMWICLTIAAKRPRKHLRPSTRHGSAHLAGKKEIQLYQEDRQEVRRRKKNGEPPESRLVLGKAQGRILSLSEKQQESNVLLTAPVGAGKSSGIIIPNLLREQGSRSLFVTDVKGELLTKTGRAISRQHKIWVFAPLDPKQSCKYNPLAFVSSIEDAQDLAATWVVNTGESKEEFWPNVAKRLMTLVIWHLRTEEKHAPFSRLADILCRLDYEELKKLLTASQSKDVQAEAKTFFTYVEANEKMLGSLMTDISTRFQLLLSSQIREVTQTNEIHFGEMVRAPIALYLSLPTRSIERCRPLIACFIRQMFSSWQQQAERDPDGRLPRRIAAYMDEFANLGVIPGINSYVSTLRASGVSMLIAIQSFHQLDEVYGINTRKNILANCVTHLLLPGAGLDETEYYSARIGQTTIVTESYSNNHQLQKADLFAAPQGSIGNTESESQRRLFTADELRTLAAGQMLVLGSSSAPILAETLPYYKEKALHDLTRQKYIFSHHFFPQVDEFHSSETLHFANAEGVGTQSTEAGVEMVLHSNESEEEEALASQLPLIAQQESEEDYSSFAPPSTD